MIRSPFNCAVGNTRLPLFLCFLGLFFAHLTLSSKASAQEQDNAEHSIIVLDVSGSMWGQIEGTSKIAIAREALTSLMTNWPESRHVGLVAYGHRTKGDCSDIETLLPVAPIDKTALATTVEALTPRGKTPLTAAVRHAAEELKYTEQKATVILLSDGVETCDLDPCAIGEELERLGVDFTAHVIGFDVNTIEEEQGLRCLAERTGGRFIPASTAEQLHQALTEASTASVKEDTPPPSASLTAPTSATKGTEISIELEAEKQDIGGYVYLYAEGKDKSIRYARVRSNSIADGYQDLTLRLPAEVGQYTLRWEDSARRVLASTEVETIEAAIQINAPSEADAATEVDVSLEAPEGMSGYVYLYAQGKDKSITYARVREDAIQGYKTMQIRLPLQEGKYTLKWLSDDKRVLAETEVYAKSVNVHIKAAETAAIGTELPLEIQGPSGLSGYLYLYAQGKDKSITYSRIREQADGSYHAKPLRLPAHPGIYEIKFLSDAKEKLAETSVEVVPAEISLTAPDTAAIATSISMELEAPSGISGYVYLFPEAKEKNIGYSRIREQEEGTYSLAPLRLPAIPGTYTLKVMSDRKEVLATRSITAEDAEYSLELPEHIAPNEQFTVTLNAPAGSSGYVYLFKQGQKKHLSYARVRAGSIEDYNPLKFTAPEVEGSYLLRWVSDDKAALTEATFSVEKVEDPTEETS